ncbi:MAG: hypothetical protein J2P41_10000 [Blastocatellia bacterium]|nr:hypothetical protein [Blastocatellia bacterium]
MNNSLNAKCVLSALALSIFMGCRITFPVANSNHNTTGAQNKDSNKNTNSARSTDSSQHANSNQNMSMIGLVRVMDEEGVFIVPIAEYRDGKLSAPSKGLIDRPKAWFDTNNALSGAWYFRKSSGETMPIKASKIVEVSNGCSGNWGMSCDLPKGSLERGKDSDIIGVAVDADAKIVNPIEEINSPQELEKIASFVKPDLDKVERAHFSKIKSLVGNSGYYYYPLNGEIEKTGLTISKLYRNRESIDGRNIYHFRAERKYTDPSAGKQSEEAISVFNGWIMQDKGGAMKLIDSQYGLMDGDGMVIGKSSGLKISSSTLLGVITIRDRIFFVTDDRDYDSGGYSIHELKGSKVEKVLSMDAYGC